VSNFNMTFALVLIGESILGDPDETFG